MKRRHGMTAIAAVAAGLALTAASATYAVSAPADTGGATGRGAEVVDWPNDCNPDNADIVGTAGSDTLQGTAADETICGMGGNDVIYGGGGADRVLGNDGNDKVYAGGADPERHRSDSVYGGRGNDYVEGNRANQQDNLYGGPGSDILNGMGCHACSDVFHGDEGDDVLRGGGSNGDVMHGDSGDDALIPSARPLIHNSLFAGTGSDVVVAVNFRGGTFVDWVELEPSEPSIGIGSCEFDLPSNWGDDVGAKAKASCAIPWPARLSGLDEIFPLTATIDEDGKVEVRGDLYNGLAHVSAEQWRDMVDFQAGMTEDVCICDPLRTEPFPGEPWWPWDQNMA